MGQTLASSVAVRLYPPAATALDGRARGISWVGACRRAATPARRAR